MDSTNDNFISFFKNTLNEVLKEKSLSIQDMLITFKMSIHK